MITENKPCPFCGGKVDPEGWLCNDGRTGPACDDCGASAPSMDMWNRCLARTEARNAALEEAAKLAEMPGVWRPHPDIPDCFRIASAIRAMMEKEGA